MSVNKVIIIGHVGQDPMIRYISDGSKLAKFSVATSEKFRTKDGKIIESTDWHPVECWGPKADLIEKYVKRGDQVFIEGKLKHSSYNKDGQTVEKSYIALENIQFFSSKKSDNNDLPEA